MRTRGFTLVEMLVVLAIIGILSALLFPVFRSARAQGVKSVCVSNLKQTLLATQMYSSEYDERMMPAQYYSGQGGDASFDRRWPQILIPYTRSFRVLMCPSDHSDRGISEGIFNPDIGPGETGSKTYQFSQRSNYGYNALNLSPSFLSGGQWITDPIAISSVTDVTTTLIFAETAWEVRNGSPTGGGSYLAIPPCRFRVSNGTPIDTLGTPPPVYGTSSEFGWSLSKQDPRFEFGGVWAWHSGRLNVGFLDGSVKSKDIRQLGAGCDVRPNWHGNILSAPAYLWDIN
ncbi:MAG: DUF1559 domain-containing protein [Armatimonadetes bacterium]|nr:DUF1559 domain-containing protein [Armatimonadota bacterium]